MCTVWVSSPKAKVVYGLDKMFLNQSFNMSINLAIFSNAWNMDNFKSHIGKDIIINGILKWEEN